MEIQPSFAAIAFKIHLIKDNYLTKHVISEIKSTLESGEDVLKSGFGKFWVMYQREREGRKPATGEAAIIPVRRVVTFKWSGKLREKINGRE
jgi:integration host factor subunit alpha